MPTFKLQVANDGKGTPVLKSGSGQPCFLAGRFHTFFLN